MYTRQAEMGKNLERIALLLRRPRHALRGRALPGRHGDAAARTGCAARGVAGGATVSVYEGHGVTLHHGDCLDVLRTLPDASVDSVVTDPPYGLEFMGKEWDRFGAVTETATEDTDASHPFRNGTQRVRFGEGRAATAAFGAWCELWTAECLRVLKPGGHLLAFGGTRTWHRLACAVEDAGFEIRDSLAWMHGQGFPKNLDVSKGLGDRRCQCAPVESTHDGDVRRVRDGVRATAEPRRSGEVADVLPTVQREGSRPGMGGVRGAGSEDARPLRSEDGTGQPIMERRGDLQAAEGQLHRPAVRPVPAGVPGDGSLGRLHHGAPSRDGESSGTLSAQVGSGESHQPRPEGQPAGELGALPVERGSQAWGGWPLCGRCGKPSIPDGLGTAAKPAFEPVVVARKPLVGTVAGNVLAWGTGALNVDGCRIAVDPDDPVNTAVWTSRPSTIRPGTQGFITSHADGERSAPRPPGLGRWPANVVLDESQAAALDEQSGTLTSGLMRAGTKPKGERETYGQDAAAGYETTRDTPGDSGGASRFFYVAKADASERPRLPKRSLRLRDDLTPEQVDHVRARLVEAGVQVD